MTQLLTYPFVQNAFLASLFISLAAGVVGYFLIIRQMTYTGHTLANVGFAGAAGALLFNLNPLVGLIIFALLAAWVIGADHHPAREKSLTVGAISTLMLGLAALFIALYHGYAEQAYSILFGNVLGISRGDVYWSIALSVFSIAAVLVLFRPLLFSSIDPEVAEARGVPIIRLALIFLSIVALIVALSVQIIGVLLIFVLLIGPAATAVRLTDRPIKAVFWSALLALIYTWTAVWLALISNLPVGFFISSLALAVYLPVRFIQEKS